MNKNIKRILHVSLGDKNYRKLRDDYHKIEKNREHKRIQNKNKMNIEKKINEFHLKFKTIMFESNISDNFDRTITPHKIKILDQYEMDGATCELRFPEGTSVDDLDKVMKKLAQNVYGKCMVYIDDQAGKAVKFSAIKDWHNIPYTPVEGLNASQFFMGYTIDLEPIIVDLSKYPHLLITGGSGGGKGKLVEIIMTNLAYNNTPEELELYYLQLSKDDNYKYELLEHCKGCVTATSVPDKLKNAQMAFRMIKHIYDIMIERGLTIKNKLGRESEDMNIHVYNKKFKKKLPVIQVWIDEAASTFKKDPNKDVNKLLEQMDYMISQISSAGRYVGVYLINVMQRASKDELPREIKVNSLNLVTFNQVDGGASKVAIGDEKSALDLPPRVFAVKAGGTSVKFAKTPFSKWDDNVRYLRSKKRVRTNTGEVLQLELEEVYAEWNIVQEEDTKVSNKSKQQSKIINKELTSMQKQLDSAQSQISLLKFDVDNKNQTIKELMARLDGKVATEESLEKISELKYTGAEDQKESIHELTNCTSEYIELPMMPNISKKIIKKGEK